jgi:hypothetical protein
MYLFIKYLIFRKLLSRMLFYCHFIAIRLPFATFSIQKKLPPKCHMTAISMNKPQKLSPVCHMTGTRQNLVTDIVMKNCHVTVMWRKVCDHHAAMTTILCHHDALVMP